MDFSSIFGKEALTLEQFITKTKGMKLVDLSTGAYVDKGKLEDQTAKLETLQSQLAERDQTIAALEKTNGDAESMRKELDRYKQQEAERKKTEEAARLDAILTQTAESALEGKEFVNDFTRAHFVDELKKAIQDPANKGKKPSALFDAMTKDLDGIFRNPQHDKVIIKGVDYNGGGTGGSMTKEQIFKIQDRAERRAAMAQNPQLFPQLSKDKGE